MPHQPNLFKLLVFAGSRIIKLAPNQMCSFLGFEDNKIRDKSHYGELIKKIGGKNAKQS